MDSTSRRSKRLGKGLSALIPEINEEIEEKTIEENETDINCPLEPLLGAFSIIGRPELEQFFNDNIIDSRNRSSYRDT